MKNILILLVSALSINLFAGVPSGTPIEQTKPHRDITQPLSYTTTNSADSQATVQTYIVKFRDGTSKQKKLRLHQEAGVIDTFSLIQQNTIDIIQTDRNSIDVIKLYQQSSDVLYIEKDMKVKMFATTPNDPNYNQLWGLHNTGQTNGNRDSDINAPEAWDITTGTSSAVIAVIDTGVDYSHPDLAANMWTNPGEIPNNGIDDDNNGYVDDIYGIDSLNNDSDPMDDHNHGTHIAGTIGAKGNNALGITGVNWDVKILACKFLGSDGGSASGAIKCLDYLANMKNAGVNIIVSNNSWGGSIYSQALYDSIKTNQDLGILFVVAAGNDAVNNDVLPSYPANYDLSNIISVAATDHTDSLAYFSSYGKNTVDVAAPGVDIYSTTIGNTYNWYDGTSMAAPHVAGLVGLIYAHNPTLNYNQIKSLILASGTPVNSLSDKVLSGRRIRAWDANGQGALTCSNQLLATRLAPTANSVAVEVGKPIDLAYTEINCVNTSASVTVTVSNGATISLLDTGGTGDTVANDGILGGQFTLATNTPVILTFPDNSTLTVNPLIPYNTPVQVPYRYETFTGTRLGTIDEMVEHITSPFDISFANQNVGTKVYISPNGVIFFNSNDYVSYVNKALPSRFLPQEALVPYWDDLYPGMNSSNGVFWGVIGNAPNRKLVIEWRDVEHYDNQERVTFQVVLTEGSSDIRYNYKDLSFGSEYFDNGRSATIGLQQSYEFAQQYCYNTANCITNQSSLLYSIGQVVDNLPIINSVAITSPSGVTNTTGVDISFNISSTPADGKSIKTYAIDFNGDNTTDYTGSSNVASYTYSAVGDYIYEVKVTDSANEVGYYYGSLNISYDATNLITATRNERDAEILADPSILGLVYPSDITANTISNLPTNAWHLISNPSEISSSVIDSVFAGVYLVLYYHENQYYGYSPIRSVQQQIEFTNDVIGVDTIPAGKGIWVYKQ